MIYPANLLELIEEIKTKANTDEYCLFITNNVNDFENNKKNVEATKYSVQSVKDKECSVCSA